MSASVPVAADCCTLSTLAETLVHFLHERCAFSLPARRASSAGYLAMQPSGVLRIAANQQTTHEWWTGHSHHFSVYVSRFVVGECAAGDSVAAADRLRVLAEVPLLEVTADVESLAGALLEEVPLPPKAATDALPIAVAAVNGVEYLLTWNCRHIAHPALRPRIESMCRRMGFEPPVICTPQELLEIDDGI